MSLFASHYSPIQDPMSAEVVVAVIGINCQSDNIDATNVCQGSVSKSDSCSLILRRSSPRFFVYCVSTALRFGGTLVIMLPTHWIYFNGKYKHQNSRPGNLKNVSLIGYRIGSRYTSPTRKLSEIGELASRPRYTWFLSWIWIYLFNK